MFIKKIYIYLENFLGIFYKPFELLLQIVLIFIISAIAIRIGRFIIHKILKKQKSLKFNLNYKRIDTLTHTITSIYTYTIYIIAFISILTYLSSAFNLQSILAAAGIGGIAIGISAQNLIRDILSGIFILLEDQFSIGDTIAIDNISGTVQEMELRSTKIRADNGDLFIISNSEMKRVINQSRGNKQVNVDIYVSYNSNVNKVFEICNEICNQVKTEYDFWVESPNVLGINEFNKDFFIIKILAITPVLKQWEIERRIRFLVIEKFSSNKIEFPSNLNTQVCLNK